MARPSESTLASMRERGFIAMHEAAELTGLAPSTLRYWATSKRVASCRVGVLRFLELEGLKDAAGLLFATKKRAPGGGRNKEGNGGADV